MLCQECGKNPAAVHLTKIVNNYKVERHLCEACAREKGEFPFGNGMQNPFSFPNLLASFLDGDPGSAVSARAAVPARCDVCGLSYQEFTRTGFLGCSHCYEQFMSHLEHVLRRVQGSTEHRGKVPSRAGGAVRLRHELKRLRQELDRVVAREEYEKAAQIRDRIRDIERQLGA